MIVPFLMGYYKILLNFKQQLLVFPLEIAQMEIKTGFEIKRIHVGCREQNSQLELVKCIKLQNEEIVCLISLLSKNNCYA